MVPNNNFDDWTYKREEKKEEKNSYWGCDAGSHDGDELAVVGWRRLSHRVIGHGLSGNRRE